jgi:hypothetical protein
VKTRTTEHLLQAHNSYHLALGHNRLAIVDLNPEAEQPFHDAEGDVHAVVNGELYGYNEIREQLICTKSMAYLSSRICVANFHFAFMTPNCSCLWLHVIGMPLSRCITPSMMAACW